MKVLKGGFERIQRGNIFLIVRLREYNIKKKRNCCVMESQIMNMPNMIGLENVVLMIGLENVVLNN